MLGLEWANLDLERGVAKLVRTKTSDEEYRQVPQEALAILSTQQRVASCSLVFPGQDFSTHLTTVRKPWVKIRARASLDDLDGTVNLPLARRALGMALIDSTLPPLSAEQKRLIDDRLASYEANPDSWLSQEQFDVELDERLARS